MLKILDNSKIKAKANVLVTGLSKKKPAKGTMTGIRLLTLNPTR